MGDLFHENIVPPLTLPPSYYTNLNLNTSSSKKNSKPKIFLQTLLGRINHKKSPHLSSSSLSFSSSYSLFRDQVTSTTTTNYRRRRFVSWGGERAAESRCDEGFVIGKRYDDDDDEGDKKKKFRGYSSSVYVVKKVFWTIVGFRSA
ncbi:hypothetical protein ACS0TY_016464 [Phlomoides rotata]